ncbi:hypothetical protein [Hydrococcus rivularis]|uniref:hypothetical protein n=1 Tax=Hydrococcus rivularis TaxID=1616834 RepID=UPI0015880407|nr:hypothetical protein [Hydrococcus rivularis]
MCSAKDPSLSLGTTLGFGLPGCREAVLVASRDVCPNGHATMNSLLVIVVVQPDLI